MPEIEPGDLLGISEIAELAGVTRQAVANWRSRDPDFPSAVTELQAGPVFSRGAVRKYLNRRRSKPMAHVTSFINLKGGVGKTTTSVALAELLAGEFGKRVLLIDLDPQTNATVMLIGDERWDELNEKGHTLATLFSDALKENPDDRVFDLEGTLQRRVSPVSDVRRLDLLPSSLDLIDVQDRLASIPMGRYYSTNPTALLQRAIKPILDEYDHVLIDCPPNLGIITLNGLRISDGFLIPTKPDHLSTYGIPQILKRVEEFGDELAEHIQPYGIIVSMVRGASSVHANTIRRLRRADDLPPIFDAEIPESNAIADAAEFQETGTLRQRYGYQGQFDAYKRLAKEFLEMVE